MQTMLRHLTLVARADFVGLQRVCRVDFDDIREMIGEIKRLDPQPGRSFAPGEPIEAIPDVLIYRVGLGWRVELNEATLPRVLVDRAYYAELTGHSLSRSEREFVVERYQAASWLAKALDQRARTMLKVAEAIFERQIGFLSGGAAYLRPLVLRDIAEATGLHESTVSRATADKFVMTPRGTFPLRYFFTTAIAGTDGEETHSAEAIRQQIRRMVEGGGGRERALRRSDRERAQVGWRRDRPTHGGEISRVPGHPIVGSASPKQGSLPMIATEGHRQPIPARVLTVLPWSGRHPSWRARDCRMINLADLVTKDRVLLDLQSGSKRQLLQALAEAAAQATGVEAATVLEALIQREKLGTTGLGEGIAIPHAKIAELAKLTGFFARLDKPVDFDALDGDPVDLVFLLLAPEAAGADHLKALARVARILRDHELRRQIRTAESSAEVCALLTGRGDGPAA